MPVTRLALLTALAIVLGVGSHAQTLRERLQQSVSKAQQGATAVQEGAGDLADTIEGNVNSSVDLMTNEPTPQEKRVKLDTMAGEILTRLFAEQPEAAELFELDAGYAVFDTRKVVLFGLAAGAGREVAASLTHDKRIYATALVVLRGALIRNGIGAISSADLTIRSQSPGRRCRRTPCRGTRPSAG